jgi:hypothetical protein
LISVPVLPQGPRAPESHERHGVRWRCGAGNSGTSGANHAQRPTLIVPSNGTHTRDLGRHDIGDRGHDSLNFLGPIAPAIGERQP